MPGFGFKIVDQCRDEVIPIVERAIVEICPLEVGLYFADRATRDYLLSSLPDSGVEVNAHLDHRRLSLLGLTTKEDALREQLTLASRIGARFVVTHLGHYPMPSRPAYREQLWDRLATDLAFAESIAADYGLRIHIENTFHPLPFYRDLCEALIHRRHRPVDICFDLGHAKVWSAESLGNWIGYIEKQAEAGARLHVHLHANGGLADEHLSFSTARRIGLTGVDDFTQGRDWFQILETLERRFPEVGMVFEVPPAEAIENYELVTTMLYGMPSRRA